VILETLLQMIVLFEEFSSYIAHPILKTWLVKISGAFPLELDADTIVLGRIRINLYLFSFPFISFTLLVIYFTLISLFLVFIGNF